MQEPSNSLVVEEPYLKDYNEGYIYYRKRTGDRKLVQLINTTSRSICQVSYARYVFQVDYWKKTGALIPDGYDVDHINNDYTDDRLVNLQLLTRFDNIRKRDTALYQSKTLSEETLRDLGHYLAAGCTYPWIRDKLVLSQGYLRYLVSTYYPDFTIANRDIFQINKEDIRFMLSKNIDQSTIADMYGVTQMTISRYVAEYLPEYTKESILRRTLEHIREGLARGRTTTELAGELKCTPSNISYYTTKYFPEYQERIMEDRDKETQILVKKIRVFCEKSVSQKDMAKLLDVPVGRVCKIVSEYLPEYIDKNAYEIRVREVGDLLKKGKSRAEIATALDIRRGVVNAIISRCYPEYGENVIFSEKLKKLKELLEDEISRNVDEMAAIVGIGYATCSNYINTYFPEHSVTGRSGQYNEEIRRLSTEENLSKAKIAEKVGVGVNYVRAVLEHKSRSDKSSPYLHLVPKVKEFLEKRCTRVYISETLEIPLGSLATLIRRQLPEYDIAGRRYDIISRSSQIHNGLFS